MEETQTSAPAVSELPKVAQDEAAASVTEEDALLQKARDARAEELQRELALTGWFFSACVHASPHFCAYSCKQKR
jgi:hypothetical protein